MTNTTPTPTPGQHLPAASFQDFEVMFHRMDARLTKIEAAIIRLETERAVNVEKQKFIEERFIQMDVRLQKIDGHISRLVWLIIAAIVGAFMTFITQGTIYGG